MARSPSASADVTRQPVGSQWTTSPSGSGSSTRLPSLAKLLNGEPYHSPSLAAHPSQELQSSIDAPHVLGSTTNSQGSSWAPPFQISSSAQSNPRKRSLPLEEETVGCSATTSRSGDSDGAHEQETDNAARPSQSPGAEDGGATPPSKRELKNSRRAAQNRAAQRAFRERKEQRIKILEQKASELDVLKADQVTLEDRWKRLEERERTVEVLLKQLETKEAAQPANDRPWLGPGDSMKPSLNLPERGQQSRDLAQEVLQMKSVIQDLEQQLEVSKEDISRRDDTIASLERSLAEAKQQ